MNRQLIYKIITFFLYLLAQVLIFNKAVLFGTAHAYVYPGFLLTLPVDLTVIPAMFAGLALGLSIDAFSNTFGIHAAASIALAYLRPRLLTALTPQRGYPPGTPLRPASFGIGWFASYALPLLLVHHLIVFFVEAGSGLQFWTTLWRAVSSTLYSFLLIAMIQYLFNRKGEA